MTLTPCDVCGCIPGYTTNDTFKQNVQILLCAIKTAVEGGAVLLSNNQFLKSQNAADSGTLNLLKANASDNTVLNSDGTELDFTIANTLLAKLLSTGELSLDGTNGGGLTIAKVGKTVTVKAGANGKAGTVILNGVTPVTVNNTSITAGSVIIFTLKTVGGTVGAYPVIDTITPTTGFTVKGTALDTSTYNYLVLETN